MTHKISAAMYLEMGIKLAKEKDWGSAVLAFGRAIQINPKYAKAYNNLGLILRKRKQFFEAEACFRKAISLNPDDAVLFNNLGLVLSNMDAVNEAIECFEQAIVLNPHIAEIYNNLGSVCEEQNDWEMAKASFEKAIELKPEYAEAYYNLGTLLRNTELEIAEKYLCHALRLRPDYVDAEMALALSYLLSGDLEKGWAPYERVRRKKYKFAKLPYSYWQGEDLNNCSMLLFWEYGFGDTIQFARYVDEVLYLTSDIVLWVQEPLNRLFKSAYPQISVYSGADFPPGEYDFACSLLSLPLIFHTTNHTIPQPRPYSLQQQLLKKWEKCLFDVDQRKNYRIGIVWASHPKHENYKRRSLSFDILANLFKNMPVTWVSLQVGERAKDLVDTDFPLVNVSDQLTDYSETAALIEQLDLVITVDTSVAHLSGTIGKKTWLLLPFAPDWRWQLLREDTPWYQSMQLFRQKSMGDWQGVIGQVKTALQKELKLFNYDLAYLGRFCYDNDSTKVL